MDLDLLHSCALGGTTIGASYQSLHGAKSRYNVSDSKLADFLSGYCELAYIDENTVDDRGLGLSIGEIIDGRDTLPIIGHFNLKFHITDDYDEADLFDVELILAITYCYQTAIKNLLDISGELSELICCVQQGNPIRTGNTILIQLNFHFPYCQVNIGFQRQYLRPLIEKLLRQNRIVEKFETQPIGDWTDIIQEISLVVPLYRSVNEISNAPMKLNYIYGYIKESDIENRDGPELELKLAFNPGNHSFILQNKCSRDFIVEMDDSRYWLPLLLSIHYWPRQTQPKTIDHLATGTPNREYDEEYDIESPIEIAKHLLPFLSLDRINMDYYWLDVGRALYNITAGGGEGLILWKQFSLRSPIRNYDHDEYLLKYQGFGGSALTVKTIAWYAMKDNKASYDEWHRAWCQKPLSLALSCLHSDVAKAIYRVYWLDYMCTNMEKNSWYKFAGNLLKPIQDAISLRQDITNKFINIYMSMRTDASMKSMTDQRNSETDRRALETLILQITNLIKQLKNENFKSTIIKACKEFFYVEDFGKVVDNDPDKTGWLNCVVEICEKTAYPRPGKPEDFITMCTNISMKSDLSFTHPLVVELMDWLGKVFVDKDLLHFFCKDVASFLKGRNSEKYFRVWTGNTNNSKSMIVKLCQLTLGNYIFDLPVNIFSGKTFGSSGPNPELAQAKGTHVGIATEPDQDDEFKGGKIKQQTGGDSFFARNCNENGGSITAFHKTILMCNRIPNIPNADKATMDRFLILPFLSTWVDDPPENLEEQYEKRLFKKDPFFESKIPKLAEAFAWLMIQYFPIYTKEGLKAPQIIKDYISNHWEERDPYLGFIKERITYAYTDPSMTVVDLNATLSVTDMYPSFKQWYRDQFPNVVVPPSSRFKEELSIPGRLGPQRSNRKWIGIRLNLPVTTNLANI